MYRRALAFSVVAIIGALGAGLSTSAVAATPAEQAPQAVVVSGFVTGNLAEGSSDAPATDGNRGKDSVTETVTDIPEEPVAEQSSATDTPVIMVTGLAVLLAAILMVVRSGSSRRIEEE
jgi:hypothetical protein